MEEMKNVLLNLDLSGSTKYDFGGLIESTIKNNPECLVNGWFEIAAPTVNMEEFNTLELYEEAFLNCFNNLPLCYKTCEVFYPIKVKVSNGVDIYKLFKKYNLTLPSEYRGMIIFGELVEYDHTNLEKNFNYTMDFLKRFNR